MANFGLLKMDIILSLGILLLLALMVYSHRRGQGPDSKISADLGINELIDRVSLALAEGEKKRIDSRQAGLFEVKEFDLEINFVVKESDTKTGGVELKVITAGMESQHISETTQKIKLHMITRPPETRTLNVKEGPPPTMQTAPD